MSYILQSRFPTKLSEALRRAITSEARYFSASLLVSNSYTPTNSPERSFPAQVLEMNPFCDAINGTISLVRASSSSTFPFLSLNFTTSRTGIGLFHGNEQFLVKGR